MIDCLRGHLLREQMLCQPHEGVLGLELQKSFWKEHRSPRASSNRSKLPPRREWNSPVQGRFPPVRTVRQGPRCEFILWGASHVWSELDHAARVLLCLHELLQRVEVPLGAEQCDRHARPNLAVVLHVVVRDAMGPRAIPLVVEIPAAAGQTSLESPCGRAREGRASWRGGGGAALPSLFSSTNVLYSSTATQAGWVAFFVCVFLPSVSRASRALGRSAFRGKRCTVYIPWPQLKDTPSERFVEYCSEYPVV